jgi:hypothetical protein
MVLDEFVLGGGIEIGLRPESEKQIGIRLLNIF